MGRIRLDMISTSGARRSFFVRSTGCAIGRSHQSDIRIALPTVAPRHALIAHEHAGFVLRGCGHGAEIRVNQEGIAPHGHVLAHGDVIEIGPVGFRVVESEPVAEVEVKGRSPAASKSMTNPVERPQERSCG